MAAKSRTFGRTAVLEIWAASMQAFNNSGQAVGQGQPDHRLDPRAWLWQDGTLYDLGGWLATETPDRQLSTTWAKWSGPA
jgi:probable HAF family extracellular repeat protein